MFIRSVFRLAVTPKQINSFSHLADSASHKWIGWHRGICTPVTRPKVVALTDNKLSSHRCFSDSSAEEEKKKTKLLKEMNIRLLTENGFLSWCRNAYLSTVVGVAMLANASSSLSVAAATASLVVAAMNLFWGTGCHISNLLRLRKVNGMSGPTLFLNIFGSALHCLLWLIVMVYYASFLEDIDAFNRIQRLQNKTKLTESPLD